MKGVILDYLKNLVSNHFGGDKWENIKSLSNVPKNQPFLSSIDVDDNLAISLIHNTCKVLNLTL